MKFRTIIRWLVHCVYLCGRYERDVSRCGSCSVLKPCGWKPVVTLGGRS